MLKSSRLFLMGLGLLVIGLLCLAQQPRAQLTMTGVGGGFGGVAALIVTWNSSDAGGNLSFTNSNLTVNNTISAWNTVRATLNKSTGKRYFEIAFSTIGAGAMGGIAITGGNLAANIGSLGVSSGGCDPPGLSNFAEGGISQVAGVCPLFVNGDVMGIAIDLDAGKVWYAQNNSYTVFNPGANPATGANHEQAFTGGTLTLFPAASLFGTTTLVLSASGSGAFSPPTGFIWWNQ